jgi:predicted deacylase
LILEAGEVWKVEPTVVEYGIRGVINCLMHLGMVDGSPVEPPYRVETDATSWVRAKHGGFLRFHVTPGDLVEKGDPLATNISLVGKRLNVVNAPRTGLVLGMTTLPAVAPGDPICHLAFPRQGTLARIERAVGRLAEDSLHERMKDDLARSVFVQKV